MLEISVPEVATPFPFNKSDRRDTWMWRSVDRLRVYYVSEKILFRGVAGDMEPDSVYSSLGIMGDPRIHRR